MTARLIDGLGIAKSIRGGIAQEVASLVAAGGRPPGLGVVLVGDDPASAVYVRNKTAACAEAGFHSEQVNLPGTSTQEEVLAQVRRFNEDPRVHGILVQLPLPSQVDEDVVVRAISPAKDADGLHPDNVARLAMGTPRVMPCTPAGIMELLRRESVELRGREAVVVGRSNIVGRPMARLLLLADATVTVAHSRTADLAEVTRRADVLVAAAGRPGMITGEMVKPGATVIDVAMNRLPPAAPGERGKLVGDCDRDSVAAVAGLLTPVPGGVGPMTIAMLLNNTLEAARRLPAA
ncbi:MAG: methylenetetrahydrofolate dehydrogenase / methenyltetrahydrofolate cyclohydrolase [Chloroflexota bacterium]|jgi:methylenetetrahydrofolate dehydrogenase (NADP+)/methenyltetrahydrofolate cyclohydrolase|nr:methylenetetrahydrofolate dehydrogenase / methenyltetrahydrofolate cyclohydrolase [Chloroflexota bacterium]